MEYTEKDNVYIDTNEFNPTVDEQGGLHGTNDKEILTWVNYLCRDNKQCIIFDVDIPDDAYCFYDRQSFKCTSLKLSNGRSIEEFSRTVKE